MKKSLFIFLLFLAFYPFSNSQCSNAVYILNNAVVNTPDGSRQYDDLKILEPLNSSYDRYTDAPNGYSIIVPKGMEINLELSPLVTTFKNETSVIEVYYDNFSGTNSNANDYIAYGSNFIINNKYHTILENKTHFINGNKVRLLTWSREKLKRVPNDKNFYARLEFIIDDNNVYTVNIKSSQSINIEKDIMAGFKKIPRRGLARFNRNFSNSNTLLNEKTKKFYQDYFSQESPLRWGIFEVSAPLDYEILDNLEKKLDYTFPILVHYQTLDDYFPVKALEKACEKDRYLEVTLQTFHLEKDNQGVIYEILDGKYDDYLKAYARQMKIFDQPVLFRLNNEMNGDWCWYNAFYYGKDPHLFRALWQYIHDLFTQEGVENVLWVFNPHDLSFPPFSWNHYLNYYPGDEYVDIIGFTGYNTGNYYPGEKWREFSGIYSSLYHDYDRHFAKPFMITEFGSNSVGGDKAAWIARMFKEIGQFPKIKIAVWWNGIDYDAKGRPARIYRLDEAEEILAVFREGLSQFN